MLVVDRKGQVEYVITIKLKSFDSDDFQSPPYMNTTHVATESHHYFKP